MRYLCHRNNDPWWYWDESEYPLRRYTNKYSYETIESCSKLNQEISPNDWEGEQELIKYVKENGSLKVLGDEWALGKIGESTKLTYEEIQRRRVQLIIENWDW